MEEYFKAFKEYIKSEGDDEYYVYDETNFINSFEEHDKLSKYSYKDLKFVNLTNIGCALFF